MKKLLIALCIMHGSSLWCGETRNTVTFNFNQDNGVTITTSPQQHHSEQIPEEESNYSFMTNIATITTFLFALFHLPIGAY